MSAILPDYPDVDFPVGLSCVWLGFSCRINHDSTVLDFFPLLRIMIIQYNIIIFFQTVKKLCQNKIMLLSYEYLKTKKTDLSQLLEWHFCRVAKAVP